MRLPLSRQGSAFVMAMILVSCGGDGGTPPVVGPVATVAITAPAAAPTLATLGRTVQFTGQARDAGSLVVTGATITWSTSNAAAATVSTTGLVTAVANGTTQIRAIADGTIQSPPVTVTVAQAVGNILITSTVATPDTLFAATRTRQFTALARDSNNNTVAGATVAWSSITPGVATVGAATGLVTAVADGSANIQAAVGTVNATRPMIVRRLVATHSITPTPTATITVDDGTQLFSGTANDSAGSAIPMTWVSRSAAILAVSPVTGLSTTATGVGNGSTRVVFHVPAVPTGVDSTTVTVTNQTTPAPPSAIGVTIADNSFRSVRNLGINPAVDTLAAGGTVTWTWTGGVQHNVTSTGSPTFANSTSKTTGTHAVIFATPGTYTYECSIHGAPMTGRVVVQ